MSGVGGAKQRLVGGSGVSKKGCGKGHGLYKGRLLPSSRSKGSKARVIFEDGKKFFTVRAESKREGGNGEGRGWYGRQG